jgi:hypothetical protein
MMVEILDNEAAQPEAFSPRQRFRPAILFGEVSLPNQEGGGFSSSIGGEVSLPNQDVILFGEVSLPYQEGGGFSVTNGGEVSSSNQNGDGFSVSNGGELSPTNPNLAVALSGKDKISVSSNAPSGQASSIETEWGPANGILIPDPNFAPIPWRRFQWDNAVDVHGPEPEPISWGRSRPKRCTVERVSVKSQGRVSGMNGPDTLLDLNQMDAQESSSSNGEKSNGENQIGENQIGPLTNGGYTQRNAEVESAKKDFVGEKLTDCLA